MPEPKRPLKVFLSYASQDLSVVQELSRRLAAEGWIDPWVDKKKLLPGQDWRTKIEEAVETSDVVIICISNNSVTKEGFVQRELRYAREIAFEKPDETIFLIPLRLDDCIVPRGLRFYQWGDYFGEQQDNTYDALLESLKVRFEQKLRFEQELARQEKEKQQRETAEKLAHEKAERVAYERAKREAAEKFERERAEKSAQEKLERETAEKAKREKAERRVIQIAALRSYIVSKVFPRLRILGLIGITIVVIWLGFWTIPKFASPTPTTVFTLTPMPDAILKTLEATGPIPVLTQTPTLMNGVTSAFTNSPTSVVASLSEIPTPKSIVVLAGNASIIQSFPAPGISAEGLTWDGENLWLSDNSGLIFKVDTSGKVVDSFESPEVTPQGITWDGSTFWVFTTNYSFVYQFRITGGKAQSVSFFRAPTDVLGGGITQDMAWDGNSLWYANQFNVTNLDTSGGIIGSFVFFRNITGLDWDGTNLWFAYNGSQGNGTLFTVSTKGDLLGIYSSPIFEVICLAWADEHLWALGRDSLGGNPMIYELNIFTN